MDESKTTTDNDLRALGLYTTLLQAGILNDGLVVNQTVREETLEQIKACLREVEVATVERRLTEAEQQLKLSRQRIATLTAVAVLAYKFRRAPIMCDEHNRLDRQLAAALEAAGIQKDTPVVQLEE